MTHVAVAEPEPTPIVETTPGDPYTAFVVVWRLRGPHWVDFAAYEIHGLDVPTGRPVFFKKDWTSCADQTMETAEAEAYVQGHGKWDGCAEFNFEQVHVCGMEGMQRHLALMRYLYAGASRLIPRWDDARLNPETLEALTEAAG